MSELTAVRPGNHLIPTITDTPLFRQEERGLAYEARMCGDMMWITVGACFVMTTHEMVDGPDPLLTCFWDEFMEEYDLRSAFIDGGIEDGFLMDEAVMKTVNEALAPVMPMIEKIIRERFAEFMKAEAFRGINHAELRRRMAAHVQDHGTCTAECTDMAHSWVQLDPSQMASETV